MGLLKRLSGFVMGLHENDMIVFRYANDVKVETKTGPIINHEITTVGWKLPEKENAKQVIAYAEKLMFMHDREEWDNLFVDQEKKLDYQFVRNNFVCCKKFSPAICKYDELGNRELSYYQDNKPSNTGVLGHSLIRLRQGKVAYAEKQTKENVIEKVEKYEDLLLIHQAFFGNRKTIMEQLNVRMKWSDPKLPEKRFEDLMGSASMAYMMKGSISAKLDHKF